VRRLVQILFLLLLCSAVCAQSIDSVNIEVQKRQQIDSAVIGAGEAFLKTGFEKGVVSQSEPLYAHFHPDANKAMWLSMAIPGAGQIYNRKYWKLPIVYGLGVGIGYAIGYTNKNYRDYMHAYQSYNSSMPNPELYKYLIPEGYPESSYSDYFKSQMDSYRRSRDISIVAAVIAYALQVIDAFVDAQLSDFDVSPDLSIQVAPQTEQVNNQQTVGVGAAVKF